jgi:hypothetical protein
MELLQTFCESRRLTLAAYLAMQRALMRRYIARGGTPEDFCTRIAPAFRRKYGPLLDGSESLASAA